MQTLEEKKALLQRAMDEGLEVAQDYEEEIYYIHPVTWHKGILVCHGYNEYSGMDLEELRDSTFSIIEPRITADDLCEAIEKQEAYRRSQRLYCEDDTALWALTKRYREQEAGE